MARVFDRFIPVRSGMDLDFGISELTTMETTRWRPQGRRRILAFNDRPSWSSSIKESSFLPSSARRTTTEIHADKVLDAPGLSDDDNDHIMHWGQRDVLAVAMERSVHLYVVTARENRVESIDFDDKVSSINWAPDGHLLAVGLNNSEIRIWDTSCGRLLNTLRGAHASPSRVGAMCWNGDILAVGGADGWISVHDRRLEGSSSVVQVYRGKGDPAICGLSWSPTGNLLASGSSDGMVHIWDARSLRTTRPSIYRFTDHAIGARASGVRALAWCPFRDGLLATGGGGGGVGSTAADEKGCIKFWSTLTGTCVDTLLTSAGPVLALVWSKSKHQILSSSAGSNEGNLAIWDYPAKARTGSLVGHTNRVLFLAQSPDGCRIASGSGGMEETIRLWNVFPPMPEEAATTGPFTDSYRSGIR